MTEGTVVTLDEAVPLVHAVVDRIAAEQDIRILFIKGPSLAAHGLREPRTSSDVDVLCDPARADDFAAALETWGWRRYVVEDTGPRSLERYADGYVHDLWPCGVDLHRSIPGFYQPVQRVFDALTERRGTAEIAARTVPTCDLLGSALVQALHLERNRTTNWYAADRRFLVEALRSRLTESDRHDLAELAAATGSADVLARFLDEVGAPPVGRGRTSSADLDDWDLRAATEETAVILWIEELRRSRLREWPRIVWRGVSYNDRPQMDDRHQISTRTEGLNLSLLLRRTWKALRYSPAAVRELVLMRRRR